MIVLIPPKLLSSSKAFSVEYSVCALIDMRKSCGSSGGFGSLDMRLASSGKSKCFASPTGLRERVSAAVWGIPGIWVI